jgi:E-phenylitaconyl-CoA hydratase
MTVHFTVTDHVAEIKLDRPEVRNAIDMETGQALTDCYVEVKNNPDIWVAIVTGAGDKAFSGGADLAKLPIQMAEPGGAEKMGELRLHDIMFGFELWKPVIAAVNGLALGGGFELAMACDIRIAAEHATFGLVQPKIGMISSAGSTWRLPRLVPHGIAMELLLTARRMDAEEALKFGLVNRVVPLSDLMPAAYDMAEKICANAPVAVRAAKEAATRQLTLSLNEGIAVEDLIINRLSSSEDLKEGLSSFLEKRKPEWKGR